MAEELSTEELDCVGVACAGSDDLDDTSLDGALDAAGAFDGTSLSGAFDAAGAFVDTSLSGALGASGAAVALRLPHPTPPAIGSQEGSCPGTQSVIGGDVMLFRSVLYPPLGYVSKPCLG